MPSSHRLSSFEGLRALAALAVLFGHYRLAFFRQPANYLFHAFLLHAPYLLARPAIALLEATYNGVFAVWLFWVLSGFVLSVQFFVRERGASPERAGLYLEESLLRRYPRLALPALASVLVTYFLLAGGFMHHRAMAALLGPQWGDWLAKNYRFIPSVGGALRSALWDSFFAFNPATTYNVILWTMEKEFLGSLCLFGFLALFGGARVRWILYPVILAALAALDLVWLTAFIGGALLCDLFAHRHQIAENFPALRGGLARQIRTSPHLALLGWLLLLGWIGSGLELAVKSYPLAAFAAIGWTLLTLPSQRWLSRPSLVSLGRISYDVYLIHMPIICSFSCWQFLHLNFSLGPLPAIVITTVSGMSISLLAGWALYHVADRPGLRFSRAFADWIVRRPVVRTFARQ